MICAACSAETGVEYPGRRDTCPRCDADLHACIHCTFYAPGQYNNCREPQAERVLDPERSNFCDFFTPRNAPGGEPPEDPRDAARARLDALFSRKG